VPSTHWAVTILGEQCRGKHALWQQPFVDGRDMYALPAAGAGVLAALNYAYFEATWTQTLPDWIASYSCVFRLMPGRGE